MAYDARAIANEILIRAWESGFEPTQIDVQKISYFLHGHHLLEFGEPLIASEFEALHYGPVQRSLLDSFRKFGEEPIRELAQRFDPVKRVTIDIPRIRDNAVTQLVEKYLPVYLMIPSFELVDITHAAGTPWSRTVNLAKNAVNIGMRISNDLIRTHFEGVRTAA